MKPYSMRIEVIVQHSKSGTTVLSTYLPCVERISGTQPRSLSLYITSSSPEAPTLGIACLTLAEVLGQYLSQRTCGNALRRTSSCRKSLTT